MRRRVPWRLGVASVVFGAVVGGAINDRAFNDRLQKVERRMERMEQDQIRLRTWVNALHTYVTNQGEHDDVRDD